MKFWLHAKLFAATGVVDAPALLSRPHHSIRGGTKPRPASSSVEKRVRRFQVSWLQLARGFVRASPAANPTDLTGSTDLKGTVLEIWLPPSEGKVSPKSGPTLDLDKLSFPGLNPDREVVIEALMKLAGRPDAAKVLKLGTRAAAEAHLNEELWLSPCGPAIEVYTGVLFEALDAPSLAEAQQEKLNEVTRVASGLFGFLRPFDLVPNHRLSVGVNLPPLGGLATWWRPRLTDFLSKNPAAASGRVVLDLRSKAYQNMAPALDRPVVRLDVMRDEDGERKVVTHWAKHWRGLAARHVILDPSVSADTDLTGLVDSLRGLPDSVVAGEKQTTEPVRRVSSPLAGGPRTNPPRAQVEVGETVPARSGGSVTLVTLVLPA